MVVSMMVSMGTRRRMRGAGVLGKGRRIFIINAIVTVVVSLTSFANVLRRAGTRRVRSVEVELN